MGNIDHKHILVFGAGGQLGKEFQYLFEEEKFGGVYSFLIKEQVDITDQLAVEQTIRFHQPDVVINCAAYTAVDKAEKEVEQATAINKIAPGHMANTAHEINAIFIHFSTDYVYQGNQNIPLLETDPTGPVNVYGLTKLEGEHVIMKQNPRHLIFRTSWVYSMFGHNFVRTMLRVGSERKHLNVVNDQVGSPTWARDLARAVLTIIDEHDDLSQLFGIYNYSNQGACSWHQFAKAIFDIAEMNVTVKPISTMEYPTPAARPPYSLLDKSKFQQNFGITIPHWELSLKRCLAEMIS